MILRRLAARQFNSPGARCVPGPSPCGQQRQDAWKLWTLTESILGGHRTHNRGVLVVRLMYRDGAFGDTSHHVQCADSNCSLLSRRLNLSRVYESDIPMSYISITFRTGIVYSVHQQCAPVYTYTLRDIHQRHFPLCTGPSPAPNSGYIVHITTNMLVHCSAPLNIDFKHQ